jgi:8-oxo-dGTP diphosphatase
MMIVKIGAIILSPQGDQLLVVRKRGKSKFIIPGGRPEEGETDSVTLRRELAEELTFELQSVAFFGEFHEKAEFEDADLTMRVYTVTASGAPRPDNEIVEARWVGSDFEQQGIEVGSTLARHVIPALVSRGELKDPSSKQLVA